MRKTIRRSAAPQTPRRSALHFTRETVRTLTPEELSKVVQAGGITCPTGTESTLTKIPNQ